MLQVNHGKPYLSPGRLVVAADGFCNIRQHCTFICYSLALIKSALEYRSNSGIPFVHIVEEVVVCETDGISSGPPQHAHSEVAQALLQFRFSR